MKQTINVYQFRDAFMNIRPNNFSYEGLAALFDYLEEYEELTGDEIELDVIGICCDFTEYESLEEFNNDYGYECEDIDDVEDYTTVIRIDDSEGFIVHSF